jgi:hypothetical protein
MKMDFDEIGTNGIHIAVLNKQFKTTNYKNGGFILWVENEVVQVKKRNKGDESSLWYCLKLAAPTDVDISEFDCNGLVVSVSHLDFIKVNWINVKWTQQIN